MNRYFSTALTFVVFATCIGYKERAEAQALKHLRNHGHSNRQHESPIQPEVISKAIHGKNSTGFKFVREFRLEAMEETRLDESNEILRIGWLPQATTTTAGLLAVDLPNQNYYSPGDGSHRTGNGGKIALLGDAIQISSSARRLVFDLGSNSWTSSLEWLLGSYPVRFDICYAWEMSRALAPRVPSKNYWRGRYNGHPLPSTIEVYNSRISHRFARCRDTGNCPRGEILGQDGMLRGCADEDLRRCARFDFARFLAARASPSDFVVVKMDIEGYEYRILDRLEEIGAQNLIDEMFVEFHFLTDDPKLMGSGWNERAIRSYGRQQPMTKENATAYFQRWRKLVPAFHAWP